MDAVRATTARRFRPTTWLCAYLLCLMAAVVWNALQDFRVQAPFNIGDWLINYSGGFVRRGLIGSVIVFLSRSIHESPILLVVVLRIVLYAVLYWTVWRLACPLRWRVWTVALTLSPATLGFLLLNGGGASRKDILFLLALSGLLLLIRRGLSDRIVVLYLCIVAALLPLAHEGLVVYWPYAVAAVAISRESWRKSLKLSLLPTIVLVVITIWTSRCSGNLDQVTQICSSIGSVYMGPKNGICGGSIAYLARDSAYARSQVIDSIRTNHYLGEYFRCSSGAVFSALHPEYLGNVAIASNSPLHRETLAPNCRCDPMQHPSFCVCSGLG